MTSGRRTCALISFCALFIVTALAQTPVDLSVHNLSPLAGGPTPTRTYASTNDKTAACIFCHAPHSTNAPNTPMWNKQLPAGNPDMYTSSTYVQQSNPISERSKLCLSCHDGTIALGQTVATGDLGVPAKMTGANVIGATDLKRDHPISFTLPARDDGEIASWLRTAPVVSPSPAIQTYDNKVECRTCHDPHVPDNDKKVPKFLVANNESAAMCTTCHDPSRGILTNYLVGAHAMATKNTVNGSTFPYDTAAKNSCVMCHTSHNAAGTGAQLLRSREEAACAVCHTTPSAVSPAPPDVMTALSTALYKHPITTVSGAHDPAEKLPVSDTRHSECQDCHNPHAAQPVSSSIVAPAMPATLLGASGVAATTGTALTSAATHEYEVCFKCHADSSNKPQTTDTNLNAGSFGILPQRASDFVGASPNATRANLRLKFNDITAVSYHPVTRVRNAGAATVPSLRTNMVDASGAVTSQTLTHNSQINCSDCHGNDASRSARAGNTGGVGPHSSGQIHILERTYAIERYNPNFDGSLAEGAPSGAAAAVKFDACNKCHDVAGIVYTEHNFGANAGNGRHQHVNETACATCHDPHGSNNPALVNFDTRIVQPSRATRNLRYTRNANGGGSCELYCHGRDHGPQSYVP
jgi:predicted CXXCH cytochrome family protein